MRVSARNHQPAEAGQHRVAERRSPRLYLIGERAVRFPVYHRDDVSRCLAGPADAGQQARLVARCPIATPSLA